MKSPYDWGNLHPGARLLTQTHFEKSPLFQLPCSFSDCRGETLRIKKLEWNIGPWSLPRFSFRCQELSSPQRKISTEIFELLLNDPIFLMSKTTIPWSHWCGTFPTKNHGFKGADNPPARSGRLLGTWFQEWQWNTMKQCMCMRNLSGIYQILYHSIQWYDGKNHVSMHWQIQWSNPIHEIQWYGAFRSHGDTPESSSEFLDGIFPFTKTIQLSGYPHDYGHLHIRMYRGCNNTATHQFPAFQHPTSWRSWRHMTHAEFLAENIISSHQENLRMVIVLFLIVLIVYLRVQ